MTQSWMYDAILYLYALSLYVNFSDFAGRKQGAKRLGEGLLIVVWALQGIYLGTSFAGSSPEPFTMTGTFLLFAWFLITVTLAVNRWVRIDMFVLLTNVFGFAMLALHFFSRTDVTPLRPHWQVSDELLFIHISLSVASYAAYFIAAVLSGMYLFLHRHLKQRHWSSTMKKLPSLQKLDDYSFKAVIIGTPMLLLSMCLGIVWLHVLERPDYMTDPKVLFSVVLFLFYAVYFVLRLTFRVPGNKLAVWNLICFAAVLLNFIGSNWFSSFHHWVWM